MKRIVVDGLPQDPLAAAGAFHQHWLEQVEQVLEGGVQLHRKSQAQCQSAHERGRKIKESAP